jgi:hypothetical protein
MFTTKTVARPPDKYRIYNVNYISCSLNISNVAPSQGLNMLNIANHCFNRGKFNGARSNNRTAIRLRDFSLDI